MQLAYGRWRNIAAKQVPCIRDLRASKKLRVSFPPGLIGLNAALFQKRGLQGIRHDRCKEIHKAVAPPMPRPMDPVSYQKVSEWGKPWDLKSQRLTGLVLKKTRTRGQNAAAFSADIHLSCSGETSDICTKLKRLTGERLIQIWRSSSSLHISPPPWPCSEKIVEND